MYCMHRRPCTKVAMYNEKVDAAAGAEEAKKIFGDRIQIMASGDYWVDFVDIHSGKGKHYRNSVARLGITKKEEVVAFGDNCNDVSMLTEAGKSYAVTTAVRKPSKPQSMSWKNPVRTAC